MPPVANNVEKLADGFAMNGYLWYIGGDSQRIYIPDIDSRLIQPGHVVSLRSRLLYLGHTAAHCGIHRMTYNLRMFWWPRMNSDISQFCRQCWVCVTKKSRLIKVGNQSSTSMHATKPFQFWMVDHIGPIRAIKPYILVAVCAYSHWVVAEFCDTTSAEDTAAVIYTKICCLYGTPANIHSDKARLFYSNRKRHTFW